MPQHEGLKVPFELSVAVHSDAGYRADNGIFGTLTIGTTTGDGGARYFSSGVSRYASDDAENYHGRHVCPSQLNLDTTRDVGQKLW